MSDDKLDENKNSGEELENVSEEALQNNTQVLKLDNNVVDELLKNTADQHINIASNTTELLNSDSEDDILHKTFTVKKKKNVVADTDSEEENLQLAHSLIDSDNEDISEPIIECSKKKKHRRLAIVDSDSDIDNEVITPHNKSFSDDGLILGLNSKEQVVSTSNTNSEEELVPDDNFVIQKSRLSTLCDPESSDEEMFKEITAEEHSTDKQEIKPKPYKKKSKLKEDEGENPRKMTGKEAAELRKEIKSESQRMVRERDVALPYHKPKSHTLKEFLARRSKFASTTPLTAKTPPSVAIKMSTEQLEVITKKLKEREKEVKEFYKSESESEDNDGDEDYIPPTQGKKESQENNVHDSKTKNVDTVVPVSDEIKDNGQDSGEVKDKEESLENNVHDSNTKNVDPVVSVSDEIKDNGQDSGVDMQEMSNKLRDHSDEDSSVKFTGLEENSIIREDITNQLLDEITVSERDNVDSDPLICPEDYINNLNVSSNFNDEKAEISNETKEVDNSETVAETNIVSKISKPVLNTEDFVTDYEFNLDDLEENSERPIIEKCISDANDVTEKPKTRFQYTDLDREIESFSSNDDKTNESAVIVPKLSKLNLIKDGLANIRPKLSGGPDHIIDLETGVAKPNDVTRLMERFAQHNLKKHMPKNKVKLSIVSVESGEIHKETVAVNVDDEDDLLEIEEKPGAKLQKLRNELQSQIEQKRSEFWQNKNRKEVNVDKENVFEGEKEECGVDDDILDDEEEEVEMTEPSEDEEDDDFEAEDRQAKNKKSDFIDEEAEESDRDDEAIEADNEDGIDTAIETEDFPESDLNGDENSKSSNISEKFEEQPVKKSLRRIVKGFVEDSDDDDDDENIGLVSKPAATSAIENKNFSNIVSQDDDYFLPPHQPQSSQTPVKHVITQEKSQIDFPTPVSYITGLQNLNNSASKSLKGSPVTSLFHSTTVPSPLKENNWHQSLQKKLFTDTDITESQLEGIAEEFCPEKSPETQEINETSAVNEEELVKVCSGTFPSTLVKGNETQLAELCSGVFPSTLEVEKQNLSPNELPSTQDLLNICSGKFTGTTQNECTEEHETGPKCTTETYTFNTNKEIKSLDADQDMIISQLIDEEEMEKFKRKFDSPLLSNTQRRIVEEFEEVVGGGGVIDSDDEDEVLEVKKKKQKRLMFSDDENSDEDENEDEEEIDLHDDVGSEYDEDVASDVPADNIGYDSEENEIELTEERAGTKLKPSDFFENEAELSESEWGSADEDEKDLDTMEFEQGDAEKFDEKKMRSDLEKIHMRRLLDDDTREVKMLQEMLLEDGELHGTGRERKFRWKNIDLMDDGNEERKDEDDVYLDEEESEEQWRKRRYEREMFLKEKQQKVPYSEDDDILSHSQSQLLKIGHKFVQRSQSNSQGSTPVDKTKDNPGSPDIKQPFGLLCFPRCFQYIKVCASSLQTCCHKVPTQEHLCCHYATCSYNFAYMVYCQALLRITRNKRGSFLSRSDHVLQRLAEYSKVTSVAQGSAKNSRKFLFQTVSVEKTSVSINEDKKRKATDGTPKAIKKLRLSDNLSPVIGKKNPDQRAKYKPFGNW